MKRVKLDLSEKQVLLIENALDMYSRLGIGQFNVIKEHPTFEKHLYEKCIPKKTPEVGDSTPQGKILEIKDGKALIAGSVNENGRWCEKQEWKDLEKVKLSTDYSKYHKLRDLADVQLVEARNTLIQEHLPLHASWGIHNENVDDSCRLAFDIHQVLRHERWKLREDGSFSTVDSSVHLTSNENREEIKVEIYDVEQ